MKHCLFVLLLSFTSPLWGQVTHQIDWPSFFSRQDLVFDTLTSHWEDGAFLGNGLLGVMAYREDSNALRFDLGRTDVTDHREGINPSIGKARLPIGRFVLSTSSPIRKIRLRLDLWNAELNGTLFTDKGTIQFQGLVAATRDVILFKTTSSASGQAVRWEWKPEPALSPFLSLGRDSASKYGANPHPVRTKEGSIHYHKQSLLAGGSYTTAWKEIREGHSSSLLITIENSYPADVSQKSAQRALSAVLAKDVEPLIRAHRNYWHQFYHKSFVSLPDSRLESFWWIQQYKMASATRVGAYPIDLMGPWYRITPWPKYWWNLNIQLTYYPFFSSNHIELVHPLLKMVNDHVATLSKNVPPPYQHNAAALGRSGPYDMSGTIKVVKGGDSTGNSAASLELGNLPWLLHVYWQAYEYTRDPAVMKKLYPVLTKSINYYLNIMEKGADGYYHLPYTYSPEYPKGITRDANYDLSLLRWGAKTLLYINKQMSFNDPLAAKWQDVLDHLTPYPQDQYGYRIGRDADFTLSHRHYSHLLMIYPIYEVNWDQIENRALIDKSLKQWEAKDEAWRGYSYTGAGSIYAMMGKGDKTHQLLNEMMDKGRFAIKPNTMYLEAGPVIETPLSAVTTLNEMLLQSWGGVIRVFPAVPDSWKEASFYDLRAKGAFLVSAVRRGGNTQFIRVKSEAGAPLRIKTGWSLPVKATGKRTYKVAQLKDEVLEVDLKKGEEVILYTGSKPSAFVVTEAADDQQYNYWGLPKSK